jgi:arabinan endo-1,5-alpha-L-arabinosidase
MKRATNMKRDSAKRLLLGGSRRTFTLVLFLLAALGLYAQSDMYANPVIGRSLPDPTVIRADDGSFYLYATEDVRNVPIYRSTDLVNWTYLSTAFTNSTRPNFEPNGGIWAPDINYINGRYVMYYSMSVWGGEQTCGIGVATCAIPSGRFTDRGKLFRSDEIGVQNSIDPFFIDDDGKKYLFWGSFHGIYGTELSDDGLSLKNPDNPQLVQIAGTAFEGTYICKRNGYYFLFASVGSCCDGLNSTYRLVVGRSESLLGPYTDKSGRNMLDNNYVELLKAGTRFKGNGHCSEIVQDDDGNDWFFVHGWDAENDANGRVLLLVRLKWERSGAWPYVDGATPAATADKPVFRGSGVQASETSPFSLKTTGDTLDFDSQRRADVYIYNLCGRLVGQFKKCSKFQTRLEKGLYIVQINTAIHSVAKTVSIN